MIVVVGQPMFRETADGLELAGLAARIAGDAAAHGRSVQVVGTAGEDDAGDGVVLALAQAGIGHVALLRKTGQPTAQRTSTEVEPFDEASAPKAAGATPLDAADVDLAMRYLTEYAVVVLADPADPDVVKVVADAAGWIGARLILVIPVGQTLPDDLPADVIVFEAPDGDPNGAFASFVGSFAAALDDGEDPGDAFRSSIEGNGWIVSTGD